MRRALLGLVLLASCSSKSGQATCPEGTTKFADACAPTFGECDERSVAVLGGGCTQVGVVACAAGFVADDVGGCKPVLPDAPCGPGTRARLGETTCTELVDCGADPYGSPVGARVLHVDAMATAGGDGSTAKPFNAFQAAYDAAVDGDTIALTDGTYRSGLEISKAITIWGRCPRTVSFVGNGGTSTAALFITGKAKVARVSITGDGVAFGATSVGVEAEDVWIHDLAADGVWIDGSNATASFTMKNSLVEKVHDTGIGAYGSNLTLDGVVVREVAPGPGNQRGHGVAIESVLNGKRPGTLALTNCLIERSHHSGIAVFGSDAKIARAFIRDVQPLASDHTLGTGILVQRDTDIGRSSDATIEDTVVTNTFAAGMYVQTSAAHLHRCTVTDTRPQMSNKEVGAALYGAQGGTFDVFDSTFARNHHVALLFTGNAHVERSIVRDVTPDDNGVGGMGIASLPLTTDPLQLDVIDSTVLHTQGGAIGFLGASGSVRGSLVRDVAPGTGTFGDGIAAEPWNPTTLPMDWMPANVEISNTLVTQVTRAAVSTLGNCHVSIQSSTMRCNSIDLAVGAQLSTTASGDVGVVDDGGGNLCGCGDAAGCRAQQSDLTPISLK